MNIYPINAIILFELDINIARKLYNRKRRIEKRDFKNYMRKAANFGKTHRKRDFKKCGRARP